MTDIKGKAWLYSSTKGEGGAVGNLRLTDYSVPSTKKDFILIDVLSVSLNPADHKFPLMPVVKWLIPSPSSLSFDFCGRIRALPKNYRPDARNLHVGQVVYGTHRDRKTLGTLKTIMWVHQDAVYPLPESVPPQHGAALGIGALTAYQSIVPFAKPKDKVLINGGAGGVGTFSIQVAKAMDMHVIATCSQAGAPLCKDLGADEILDYKSPTFYQDLSKLQVDLVVDNVGHDTAFHSRSKEFLKPDGQFMLVAMMDGWAGKQSMLSSWLRPAWLGGVPRKWAHMLSENKISDYEAVTKMVEQGQLKIVVDSVYSFADVPEAFAKLKAGRAKGKILINVGAYASWPLHISLCP